MSGVIGILVAAVTALQGPLASSSPTRHEFVRPAMGTEFRIVLYAEAENSAAAHAAADAAFERIDELESTLSDYDPESELSRLARASGTGTWVPVSDDLWLVIQLSQTWAVRTQGAFDITIGPVTRLWRWANRRGRTMPPGRVAQAMESVGYQKLEMDPTTRSVRLTVTGMRLDAGGIGKGYAADEALALLRSHGFTRSLVDAGGDLRVGDAPPDRQGWEVAVPELDERRYPSLAKTQLRNTAVATSGDTYRHTTDDAGVRRSHILDPRRGHSSSSERLVTVFAPTAAIADLLASAASVMSIDELERLQDHSSQDHLIRIMEPSQDGIGWSLRLINSTGTN